MPYVEKITKAGRTCLYERAYSTYAHPKGERRRKKEKLTKEAQEKINNRKQAREICIYLNANFHAGDYHVTLTYTKERRPETIDEAKKDRQDFLKRLRRRIKKEKGSLKYLLVTEAGTRGALHHHAVINQMPVEWIRQAWPHGRIDIRPLDDSGQYSRLADYFAKYLPKWKRAGGTGWGWTHSRNLYRPGTKKRVIRTRNRFCPEPKAKKGFYIDRDTVENGISEYTGYEFLRYILVKEERSGPWM